MKGTEFNASQYSHALALKRQPLKNAGFLLRVGYYEPMISIPVTLSKICSLKSGASSIQSERRYCVGLQAGPQINGTTKTEGIRNETSRSERPQNEQAHNESGVQTFNRKSPQHHVF